MVKKRLIGFLAHAKKYIYLNVLWQWLTLLSQIFIVFFTARLLESVFMHGTVIKSRIIGFTAIIAGAVVLRSIASKASARCTFLASKDVKTVLRDAIFSKLLRLGASYRETVATSEAVQVTSEGVEQLEVYFGRYLPQLFYSLAAPLTLFAVLAPLSLRSASVLFCCVPLIPLSIVAVQKIAKRLLKKYWSVYTGLGDDFLENLQGLTTLKIYQADHAKSQEMDSDADNFRRITMKVLTMQLNSITIMDILAYGGSAVGIISIIYEYAADSVSFSSVIIFILLAAEFFIPLRMLGSLFHIAMNGMTASDKIFYLLDLPEPPQARGIPEGASGSICLRNLSFSYEEERPLLKNTGLVIPHGSFISLVGESGSGKSTVAALLCGKYKKYEGEILIGGMELRSISEKELMQRITLVKHNSYLFKGTVADTLRAAKPDASDSEMNAVLKKVNLYDFLKTQRGLDTELLESASNLSGGQRQRLALARALLFDSPVYIFDEATSNIDAESENMIMQVIHGLKNSKTVIFISHRLANSVQADAIYFLEHGIITEQGTHQELLALGGKYCTLYENQKKLEQYGEASYA